MKKDLVTIVWGDSIVYGWHDDKLGGWVNRLKIELYKKNKRSFVLNMGIPGQTSTDVLKRFERELLDRFTSEDDYRIIFSVGIKDSLLINEDDYLEIFKSNIRKLIKKAKKYTDNITFLGLFIPNLDIRKEYRLENVVMVDKIISELCKINRITYIDLKKLIKCDDLFDGLHPNEKGYAKICKEVLKKY